MLGAGGLVVVSGGHIGDVFGSSEARRTGDVDAGCGNTGAMVSGEIGSGFVTQQPSQ